MKTASMLRGFAVLAVIGAAAVAGYAVYDAQRTEQVYVASHEIPPYTKLSQSDLIPKQVPMKAVQADAVRDPAQVVGHLTSMEILPEAQIRAAMISSNHSLQGLVNISTDAENVTFPIAYKQGAMDEYIPPNTYVDLVAQGSNNTTMHADHVLVLGNTGYDQVPSTKSNNSQNLMLIMTLPESTYLSMAQNLANGNVQVLMVNQTTATGTGQAQTVSETPNATSSIAGNTTTSVEASSSSNAPTTSKQRASSKVLSKTN